jgi:aminoglycoside 6'-N-acetyltransferase
MRDAYAFRTFETTDLILLRDWLATPEARRWWGDPDEQFVLIEEDLGNQAMRQWLVSFEDRPFAYAQSYDVHVWPQPHLAALPPGTVAIDAFIGVPEMIGRGHGGNFLRLLTQRLLAERAPLVVIDPGIDNLRAQHAYRRAGFRDTDRAETDAGPVLLMTFSGS